MTGHPSRPANVRSIAHGGSSKPAVISVVTPPDRAAGMSAGLIEVDVAVDRARRRDQAVAHDRRGVRADRELDAVADRAVAGPSDADDPAVLDADVGLDDAEDRVDDERAGDDRVELRVGPGRSLGRSGAGASSRSPRSARRPAPGGPRRPGPRGRCRPGGRGRRSSGRSGRGARPGRGGSSGRLDASPPVAAEPDEATVRRLARRPALGGPAGRSRRKPAAGVAIEDEPRVDAIERVVGRHADHAARDSLRTVELDRIRPAHRPSEPATSASRDGAGPIARRRLPGSPERVEQRPGAASRHQAGPPAGPRR